MENDWTGFRFEFPPRVKKSAAKDEEGPAETPAVDVPAAAPVEGNG
jgi:hypothetical protein